MLIGKCEIMNYPKLSIVTPSYNQANFLEQTICSVLDQGYPELEYIVIDGGSTDGSVEIIRKYEKYISYWVSEPDNGQAHALNKGFKLCTGVLVGWQNSDDYYLPGAFEKVAKAFETHPADVYYGHKYNVDVGGKVLRSQCYVPYSLHSNIYEGMIMANQSAFWRRELFSQIGYLDDRLHYALDYDFFLRIGISGANFCLINDWLGCLRIHQDAKTSQHKERWQGEIEYVEQKLGIHRRLQSFNTIISRIRRTYHYLKQKNYGYLMTGVRNRLIPGDRPHGTV